MLSKILKRCSLGYCEGLCFVFMVSLDLYQESGALFGTAHDHECNLSGKCSKYVPSIFVSFWSLYRLIGCPETFVLYNIYCLVSAKLLRLTDIFWLICDGPEECTKCPTIQVSLNRGHQTSNKYFVCYQKPTLLTSN